MGHNFDGFLTISQLKSNNNTHTTVKNSTYTHILKKTPHSPEMAAHRNEYLHQNQKPRLSSPLL